jgi:hypothetical protein
LPGTRSKSDGAGLIHLPQFQRLKIGVSLIPSMSQLPDLEIAALP